MLTSMPPAKVIESLNRTSHLVYNLTGTHPVTFRPPWGRTNAEISLNIRTNTLMTPVLWSLDSSDWKRPAAPALASHVVGRAKQGDVILCHDVNPVTLEALPGIIDGLLAKKLELRSLSFVMERTREVFRKNDEQLRRMYRSPGLNETSHHMRH